MRNFGKFVLVAVLVVSFAHALHANPVRTVAMSGTQAPGLPSGMQHNGPFGKPTINSAAQVAFLGHLSGEGVPGLNSVIWSERLGELTPIARSGQQAVGTPGGETYQLFRNPQLAENGKIAFIGQTAGTGFPRGGTGIWSESRGSLGLVAHTREHPPGTPTGTEYLDLIHMVQNSVGETAFRAKSTHSWRGIWAEDSGSVELIANSDDFGSPYIFLGNPTFGAAGRQAFVATTSGIWSQDRDSAGWLARSGDHAPGLAGGINFSGLYFFPVGNAAGQIAFPAYWRDSNDPQNACSGIWSEGDGTLSLVAASGDPVPGAQAGIVIDSFHERSGRQSSLLINDAGQTAFTANLAGDGVDFTNSSAIFSEGSGSLEMVARLGNHAPGTPPGVTFENFPLSRSESSRIPVLDLNNNGQTAFVAALAGSSVDDTNDIGIWAEDALGDLQLIVREGDTLNVSNDPNANDLRVISEIHVSDYYELDVLYQVQRRWLNDRGQLAFAANFTDGSSGIFVSNLIAVPEPGSMLLAAVGVFTLPFWKPTIRGCSPT